MLVRACKFDSCPGHNNSKKPEKQFARMAELVDALVSGTSSRKGVQVRFLFRALQVHKLIQKQFPFIQRNFFLYFPQKNGNKNSFSAIYIKADKADSMYSNLKTVYYEKKCIIHFCGHNVNDIIGFKSFLSVHFIGYQ